MTSRRLLMLALVLLLGAGAVAGVRVSGATYVDDSRTDTRVSAADDWTPPLVSVTSPGASVSGSVPLSAAASDARGRVVSVDIAYRATGAASWATICTDTGAPWSCTWDTSNLADGSYELRASATDDSGNTGVSAIVTTEVLTDRGWVSLRNPGEAVGGRVSLTATSTLWFATVSYVFEYAPAGTNAWATACTTASYGRLPGICTWDTSALSGNHDLRVRASATDNGSAVSVVRDVLVDNVDPTVTLTVPSGTLSGTIRLEASAADAQSGLSSVAIASRAAGSSWVTCATSGRAPVTCSLDTTDLVDGSHEFRAVATDRVGNQTITATVTRTVTNVLGTVTITSPSAGVTVRGRSVTVSADATAVRGVASVRFEVKPAGSKGWILLCTTTAAPYRCTADSTTAPQGAFEIRAVLTDRAEAFFVSPVVTVTVDNTPPRTHDVQASNGGVVGRADKGDRVVLTFTDLVAPGSIRRDWDGRSVVFAPTLHDRAAQGSVNNSRDNLVLTGTNLGSVSFTQNYLNPNARVTFNGSTMVASTATVGGRTVTVVTITLGTGSTTNGLVTDNGSGAMSWAPGAGMLSPEGLAASTAAVTETGTNDRDF